MRILEETKDYIIVYSPESKGTLTDLYFKNKSNKYYFGYLVDQSSDGELYSYRKDTGNFPKDIQMLGRNLIKKFKESLRKK